jgi:hypothetical protein
LIIKNKSLVITSFFIKSRDTSYIHNTIIDGQNKDCTIKILDCEGKSIFFGLTIQNGKSEFGGGIYCRASNPYLDNVILRYNNSHSHGGGVYCENNSKLKIYKALIYKNSAIKGSGISCKNSILFLSNLTVVKNDRNSFFCDSNSSVEILNSLFWSNKGEDISAEENVSFFLAYSLIQDTITIHNKDQKKLLLKNAIFNRDPEFIDSEKDKYFVNLSSPCIDNGIDILVIERDTILHLTPDYFSGAMPDIGFFEFSLSNYINNRNGRNKLPVYTYPEPKDPIIYVIEYYVPKTTNVYVSIINSEGIQVADMTAWKEKGIHVINWNITDEPNGKYTVNIYFNDYKQSKEIIIKK